MAGDGRGDGAGRPSDDVAAAREAAARLPRPESRQASGEPGVGRGEQVSLFVIVAVTLVGSFAWLVVQLWQEPWGWLMVLGGLPVYVVGRLLFFRMRGTETAQVAVDGDGIIHVVRGRRAVRRMQRLYDVGTPTWMRHALIGGFLLPIIGLPGLAIVAVALDAPWVMMVFLTAAGFLCLDMVRIFGLSLWPRKPDRTMLDPYVMLAALALYARHHGHSAAVSGVRADDLASTLAAHPDDWNTAQEYGGVASAMAQIATGLSPGR